MWSKSSATIRYCVLPTIMAAFAIIVLVTVETADAGVLEVVRTMAKSGSMWIGIGTVVLLYVLKRIPNEMIQKAVGRTATFLGRLVTLNLSKFKYTAPFWEAYVESVFIDLINNTLVTFVKKFEEALRSDNTIVKRNGNGG